MNKKLKVILTVSIILNVLLIGVVAGGLSQVHKIRGFKSQQMDNKLAEIMSVLPASKSENFKQRLDDLIVSRRADRLKIKAARKNIMQVFEQEVFDRQQYQKMVKEMNNLHQQQMVKRTRLMMDMAEYLSPQERKQLARLIFKRRGRNN